MARHQSENTINNSQKNMSLLESSNSAIVFLHKGNIAKSHNKEFNIVYEY